MNVIERFMSKVKFLDNGCWEFTSCLGKNGYTRFKLDDRLRLAHRVSYEMFKGIIPEGHQLHHTCEFKRCVNPEHLTPVLPRVHLLELSPKAPAFINSRVTHCPKGHAYTDDNTYTTKGRTCKTCKHELWLREAQRTGAKSRLTPADVLVIRDLSQRGVSVSLLAALYDMKQGAVRNIKIGRSWSNVTLNDLI